MLLVSLVAVLFISGKCAFRVDFQDYGVEQSNEIIDSDEVIEKSVDEIQSNSENESEELEVEPIKRSKKSYNPFAPCDLCGYNANSYNRPSMIYSQPQYRPNVGFNNYNLHPKPAYHQPSPPPNYAPPTYNSPSPPHPQPHYNYYENNNKAPVYPAPSNVYPNPHPHLQNRVTSSNLLIGCHPHVQSVPALSYPPNYDISPYGPPPPAPPHSHIPMEYRFHSNEDSVHSASRNPDISNEVMPEKISLLDNSSSKNKITSSKEHSVSQSLFTMNDSEKSDENNKKDEKSQQAQLQQQDTLFKMAKIQEKLSSRKTNAMENKSEPAAGKTDQVKKT